MINLITSFFRPENTERLNELVVCLKNNINSKYIKKIYLFMERKEDIEFLKETIKTTGNKIQLILWNKQPFYSDYLNLANQLKGEICMISNADIWLKECDVELINLIKTNKNIGYALTRHDYDMSCDSINEFGNIGSFDCFIFISPKLVTGNIKHVQNIPGSEHIFKYFWKKILKLNFIIFATTLLLFMNINQIYETIMKEIYYIQPRRGGKIKKRPLKIILITFTRTLKKTSYERHPLLKIS